MKRRRVLGAVGATLGLAGVAGCLGAAGGGGDDPSRRSTDTTTDDPGDGTSTTDDSGTARPERTRDPGTDDPEDYPSASDEFDPDLPVRAENRDDAAHALELAVSDGGSIVHEATYELSPGDDRAVYNLRETDPDGIERYTVGARVGDWNDTVEVETSGCYGHVLFSIDEDGEPFLTYSIC